jgi:hypothetical protein
MGRLRSQSTKQPASNSNVGSFVITIDETAYRARWYGQSREQSQPCAVGLRNVDTLAEEQVHSPHPQPGESGVVGGPSVHQVYLQ